LDVQVKVILIGSQRGKTGNFAPSSRTTTSTMHSLSSSDDISTQLRLDVQVQVILIGLRRGSKGNEDGKG